MIGHTKQALLVPGVVCAPSRKSDILDPRFPCRPGFKLSGMRWKKAGAQTILTLRVILLSGVWEQVYERMLAANYEVQVRVPDQLRPPVVKEAV